LFDGLSYSNAQLKKAGISLSLTNSDLTFDQVARLHGYKNFEDASRKGFDFKGATSDKGFFGSSGEDVATLRNRMINQLYQKTTTKNEMNYRVTGDKGLDKEMSKFFLSSSDLTSFQPAYFANWKDVPGFNEEGKLAPGTVLNITENRSPKIILHGNSLFYEVPIKYDVDGKATEGTVVIKPKLGMNVKHDDLLYKLDAASSGTTALDKQTNSMIKAARFDSKFQGNNLSPQLIQSVAVTPLDKGGKSVELYSVPFDANTRLEVVKIQGKAGDNPVIKIAYMDNSGKRLGYLTNPETGKDWYKNADSDEAAPAAKDAIMQALAYPR
jgi:hypothetical protein